MYFAHRFPSWFRQAPLALLQEYYIRSGDRRRHDGVYILDYCRPGSYTTEFTEATVSALRLVEKHDPRRYLRVRRELRAIANVVLPITAYYRRVGKTCCVDFTRLRATEHLRHDLRYYACVLIHEATHGHLYSKRVANTSVTNERIEALCNAEVQRFVRRLEGFEPNWEHAFYESTQNAAACLAGRLRCAMRTLFRKG